MEYTFIYDEEVAASISQNDNLEGFMMQLRKNNVPLNLMSFARYTPFFYELDDVELFKKFISLATLNSGESSLQHSETRFLALTTIHTYIKLIKMNIFRFLVHQRNPYLEARLFKCYIMNSEICKLEHIGIFYETVLNNGMTYLKPHAEYLITRRPCLNWRIMFFRLIDVYVAQKRLPAELDFIAALLATDHESLNYFISAYATDPTAQDALAKLKEIVVTETFKTQNLSVVDCIMSSDPNLVVEIGTTALFHTFQHMDKVLNFPNYECRVLKHLYRNYPSRFRFATNAIFPINFVDKAYHMRYIGSPITHEMMYIIKKKMHPTSEMDQMTKTLINGCTDRVNENIRKNWCIFCQHVINNSLLHRDIIKIIWKKL